SSPCIGSIRLGTRQECVGSSPRISGVCQDGAREFARRRPRLAGRLSGVAEKLAGRLTMTGATERFAEGIGKLTVNTSGDRRKKTGRLAARMSEAAGLAGVELNWLTRGLVNIRFKPKFEKWREPLLWKFRRVYRCHPGFWAANDG
ncbi:hypothetical protein BHE74_00047350, partial [Ensete ventricosum]